MTKAGITMFLVVVLVISLVVLAIAISYGYQQKKMTFEISPKNQRRNAIWENLAMGLLWTGLSWHHLVEAKYDVGGLSWFGCLLPIVAILAFKNALDAYCKKTGRKEELQAYIATDGEKCGRCGYDLSMIRGDVCPECGWESLKEDEKVESPMVWLWWRKWEIDYLENATKEKKRFKWGVVMWLIILMIFALMYLCLSQSNEGEGLALGLPSGAILLLLAHWTVNHVRVRQYIRRVEEEENEAEVKAID